MSQKKSLFVICKILKLFVTTVTADEKYSLLNRDNLTQPIHMQISQKQKSLSRLFFCIFEIYIKFVTFSNKGWPSLLVYVRKWGLRKTWLDNCLKSPFSEDPSTRNMVNGPESCSNLNESAFTIFFDLCEGSCVGKSLS